MAARPRYQHIYRRQSRNGVVSFQYRFKYDGVEQNKGGFKTARAAHLARLARERALITGKTKTDVPQTAPTLRRFVEDVWYVELQRSVEANKRQQNYVDGMKADFDTYIFPPLGRIRLDLLDEARCQKWLDDMRASGRVHAKKNGDRSLASSSMRTLFNSLNLALKYAAKQRYIGFNPMMDLQRDAKSEPKTDNTYSEDELAALYAGIEDDALWFTIFVLLFTTGMRAGEIAGLRWNAVELRKSKLHVKRQRTTDHNGRAYDKDRLKSKSSKRAVDLDEAVIDVLRDWKLAQQAEFSDRGKAWSEDTNVFTNEHALTPLHPSALNRKLKTVSQRLGLKVIRFHDGRHTAATLLMGEVATKIVTEMLGHASTGITEDLYQHSTPTMHREAAAKLGALVPTKKSKMADELAARRQRRTG